ncbi:MAG: hypothetical protein ACUVQ8_08730 [Nitrososphaeria archaeon]
MLALPLIVLDVFGIFGTTEEKVFDDELNISEYEDGMRRYFADIVSDYSQFVLRAAEKIKGFETRILCTTYGPIHRDNPKYAI